MEKFRRVAIFTAFFLLSICSFSQPASSDAPVEMADTFYSQGKVFVVVVVVSMVVIGMLFYLFLLDRKLKRLEKELNNKK